MFFTTRPAIFDLQLLLALAQGIREILLEVVLHSPVEPITLPAGLSAPLPGLDQLCLSFGMLLGTDMLIVPRSGDCCCCGGGSMRFPGC